MSNMTESPATTPIPVQLSEPEFIAFIFPHLSMPRRGPKCKPGYHRVFNLILWVLYTGMQHLDLSVLHGDGSNTVAKKGGDGIGYSGHKHQKGEKVLAIVENNGFVLAPLPVAPVNEADTVLLPDGLNALKRVARLTEGSEDRRLSGRGAGCPAPPPQIPACGFPAPGSCRRS